MGHQSCQQIRYLESSVVGVALSEKKIYLNIPEHVKDASVGTLNTFVYRKTYLRYIPAKLTFYLYIVFFCVFSIKLFLQGKSLSGSER